MSQLYELTQKIHELIDQLREKGVGIGKIESENKISIVGVIKRQDNEDTYFDDFGPYEHWASEPVINRLNYGYDNHGCQFY